MAANKRKILEAARKHAQKGAKEKALKEYDKLLKLDPRDAKLRLEIGDAHRRWGQIPEAKETYNKVAEQFMKEGFDARAVAVYKQIQNLDAESFDCYEPLAELYQRMGLTAEAISTLQAAADGYHKAGNKESALGLLRKMATIDPTNTTSRLKVADLLKQEGLTVDALSEYDAVADELEGQGDLEGMSKVFERILEVDEARVETLARYARCLIERGLHDRAEPFANRAIEGDPSPEHYELLVSVCKAMHRDEDLVRVYTLLADAYHERGDDERSREIRQRFLPAGDLSTSDASKYLDDDDLPSDEVAGSDDLGLGDDSSLLDEDLLADESLLMGDGDSQVGFLDSDTAIPAAEPSAAELTTALPQADGFDVEADIEQLLAEASVYLRYGKRDQAIENLERVLEVDADHRTALEKLGEAHSEAGASAEAVEAWKRAATLAAAAGETDAVAVLRGRIEAIDPEAAAQIEVPAAMPSVDDELEEISLDDEFFDDSEDDADVADEILLNDDAPSAKSVAPDLAEIDLDDIEVDIDAESFVGGRLSEQDEQSSSSLQPEETIRSLGKSPAEQSAADSLDGAALASLGSLDDEVSVDDGVSLDDGVSEESDQSIEGEASPADEAPVDDGASTTQQVNEDLEEADFYFQQGLFDEAQEIYERVLALVPNHPHAQVRMGELAAERGEEPAGAPAAPPTDAPMTDAVPTDALPTDAVTADEFDVPDEPTSDDLGSDLADWDADPEDSLAGFDANTESDAGDDLGVDLDAGVEDEVQRADPEALTAAGALGAASEDVDAVEEAAEPDDLDIDVDVEDDLGLDDDDAVEAAADEAGSAAIDAVEDSEVSEQVADIAEDAAAADESQLALDDEEPAEGLSLSEVDDTTMDGDVQAGCDPNAQTRDPVEAMPGLDLDDEPEPEAPFAEADASEPDEAASNETPAIEPEIHAPFDADTTPAPSSDLDMEPEQLVASEAEDAAPSFDLAAELADALDDTNGASGSETGSRSDDGFEAVFAEFKKGVSATLSEGDHEAHYDLGIAYREMGLLGDAMTEFRAAKEDPARAVECLHMLGICATDQGQPEEATGYLREALAYESIGDEQQLAVRFELGRALASSGENEEAREAFEAVRAVDPSFCDVEARIEALDDPEKQEEETVAASEYESFDEFFGDLDESDDADDAEQTGEVEVAEAEAFESFDDVISDAEAIDDEPDAESEVVEEEDTADGAELPTAAPDSDPAPRRKKKKKISFV